MSLIRIAEPAGKQQIPAPLVADLKGEESGNECGHKADPHLSEAEFRCRRGQREVADDGQSRASGDGCAMHRSNGRNGQFVEGNEESGDALGIRAVLGRALILHSLQRR